MSYGEGLSSLHKLLETRDNKQILIDTLTELSEVFLKNNIFEFDEKKFQAKQGISTRTNFAAPYIILFMADLEDKTLGCFEKKSIM